MAMPVPMPPRTPPPRADQRGGGGVIDLVPTVVRDNSAPLPAAMITPGESAASLRFRERMHAHHRVYQEQIEANQEKEYRRAVAAREKRKKRTRDWERVVAAVMRGLAASRQTAAPAPAEGAPASAAAPPATPAPGQVYTHVGQNIAWGNFSNNEETLSSYGIVENDSEVLIYGICGPPLINSDDNPTPAPAPDAAAARGGSGVKNDDEESTKRERPEQLAV